MPNFVVLTMIEIYDLGVIIICFKGFVIMLQTEVVLFLSLLND